MKKTLRLSTTHAIMLSFFGAILAGSLLLSLPVSSASGQSVPYVDALFTATTATCVTGLVTLPTFSTWSVFGQAVILLLIQAGGLGIITVMSGVMITLHKKMGLAERMLIQDAFNLNTLSGLVRFIKKVILGTLAVEGVGALLYMTVFVPQFGLRGIWISVFTAVSAFCNAGIDLIAENSLCDYASNPVINAVTCALIIVSGIGYVVWWDVIRVWGMKTKRKFSRLTLHSKIALSSTLILIIAGTVLTFVFEYNNPLTIKSFSLFDKIQASFFQSVTTRTAGFFTIPQENLTNGSALVSLLLMFIGGSPVGTAGGAKTVTFAVIFASALAAVKNRRDVSLFGRNIKKETVSKAAAVTCMSFVIMFTSTLLLAAVTESDLLNLLYETVSATATVGLTRGLTPTLNTAGKIIIILTMYLGRVGPISLAIAFNRKKQIPNIIKNPTEEISVG